MKNKFIILFIMLFATGCSCEYNLTIDNNNYQEEVTLNANNENEINSLNKSWKIAVDKDKYNIGLDEESNAQEISEIYDYKLSNNILTFSHDFNSNNFYNSTAASFCFNKVTVYNYSDSIVISTSNKTTCFDKYPNLDSVKINLTIDKEVKKHDADTVKGKTYTWLLTRENHDKGINLIIDNSVKENNTSSPSTSTSNPTAINKEENNKKDYTMYIFYGILIVIVSIVYLAYNHLKSKENDINKI